MSQEFLQALLWTVIGGLGVFTGGMSSNGRSVIERAWHVVHIAVGYAWKGVVGAIRYTLLAPFELRGMDMAYRRISERADSLMAENAALRELQERVTLFAEIGSGSLTEEPARKSTPAEAEVERWKAVAEKARKDAEIARHELIDARDLANRQSEIIARLTPKAKVSDRAQILPDGRAVVTGESYPLTVARYVNDVDDVDMLPGAKLSYARKKVQEARIALAAAKYLDGSDEPFPLGEQYLRDPQIYATRLQRDGTQEHDMSGWVEIGSDPVQLMTDARKIARTYCAGIGRQMVQHSLEHRSTTNKYGAKTSREQFTFKSEPIPRKKAIDTVPWV